jgi:hypothetical protein
VPSPRGLDPGQNVNLTVDLDRILVFGPDGRRLDAVYR